MAEKGYVPLGDGRPIEVPESWLRFVAAIESIAADFKRYVDASAQAADRANTAVEQSIAMHRQAIEDLKNV
jgi:hypothetical protein